MARTGRRKGSPDTKDAIVNAARDAFAERGFDGASIRGIATSAGVDPALVYHYFATKEELFLEVVGAPTDPSVVISEAVVGPIDEMGERIVRMFIKVWGDPALGPALAALVRSGLAHEWSARMLREFATSQILRRITSRLDVPPDEAKLRASLVASQMLGLGVTRYLLKIEPLASASVDRVAALVGPTVQHYLTGDLKTAA
jgi:AcrR family transcriptional regulator